MANILITGASGFIGSFLVEEGLRLGYKIYAGIRETSKLNYLPIEHIELLILDLSDKEKLKTKWQELKRNNIQFDYVIHNAGITLAMNPNDFDLVNNVYTQNLYNSLVEADFMPKKFVLMSSLAAMGPGNDNSLSPIKKNQHPRPITVYGRSKLKAEEFLKKSAEIPYVILRPTAVYGPRDKDFLSFFKIINWHIEPYMGSPTQLLSFIYVKDLARIALLSLSANVINKTYHVSDGHTYTCLRMAELTKAVLKKKTLLIVIPTWLLKAIVECMENVARIRQKPAILNRDKYKELTAMNWSCDDNELFTDINYTPLYSLLQGIREVIDWYKEKKWL